MNCRGIKSNKPEGNTARLQGEVTRPDAPPEVDVHPPPREFRVPVSVDEIGLHHWTSRAARLKLPDYLRAALDEKARATVQDLVSRGKKIPTWVAKLLDRS